MWPFLFEVEATPLKTSSDQKKEVEEEEEEEDLYNYRWT